MKRILSILVAVLLLLCLCACQSSQKDAAPMLAFVHRAGEDAYTTALAESFSKTAKQLGYDCTALTPENDSAEAQATLIEDLIKRGVRGIALNANQSEGLEDVLKKAADAGIPVITLPADTKGSKLLVQPSSPQLMGIALMDAMLELTDGEGSYAMVAGEDYQGGIDMWVSGLNEAARDNKYEKLVRVETTYTYDAYGGLEETKTFLTELVQNHPEVEAICCPDSEAMIACAQAVEALGLNLKVTGMANYLTVTDLVGADRACPYYFFWNPEDVGVCAANALAALIDGASLQVGGTLTTKLGSYEVQEGAFGEFSIVAGAPYRYTK